MFLFNKYSYNISLNNKYKYSHTKNLYNLSIAKIYVFSQICEFILQLKKVYFTYSLFIKYHINKILHIINLFI